MLFWLVIRRVTSVCHQRVSPARQPPCLLFIHFFFDSRCRAYANSTGHQAAVTGTTLKVLFLTRSPVGDIHEHSRQHSWRFSGLVSQIME